jgi:hypothetical protein
MCRFGYSREYLSSGDKGQSSEQSHSPQTRLIGGDNHDVKLASEQHASPNLVGQFSRLEMTPEDAEDFAALSNCSLLPLLRGHTGGSSRIDHDELTCDSARFAQKRTTARFVEDPEDMAGEDALDGRVT